MSRHTLPPHLASGAARGWHVLLLYSLVFLAMTVASIKLARQMAPEARVAWQLFTMQGLTASLVAAFTLAVPELRRSLPDFYLRPRSGLQAADVAVYVALAVAWTHGAHRFLVVFPALHWFPSLISSLGYAEHVSRPGGVTGLLILVTIAFIAPVAEELVFRGYLLNLWMKRWGMGPGIVLSSIVFGASHFHGIVFAMALGVFLSLVYLRFHSLWPGTLLHSLANIVTGPFGMAPFFVEKSRAEVLSISAWVPEMVLTIAFFPLLYIFWRRFRPGN